MSSPRGSKSPGLVSGEDGWPGAVAVFVDSGYRTGLGVGFYDRVVELGVLSRLVRSYRVVVVYGPRNAGKSELVRYWARRRAAERVVGVSADLLRARGLVEGLEEFLLAPSKGVARALLDVLREASPSHLRLLELVYRVYSVLRRAVEREAVLFIDEFHLLPGYAAVERGEALADLEALAHSLAKRAEAGVRVVLTTSEGFVATVEVFSRLHGYSTAYMPVEPLDAEHFKALYEEYRERSGCNTSYRLLYGMVGGAPGYLPTLCQGREAVEEFVEESKMLLDAALQGICEKLEEGTAEDRLDAETLMRQALAVLQGPPISPLEAPRHYRVGRLLVEYNIAYPIYEKGKVRFKPQTPLYPILLEAAIEENTPVADVDPQRVIERIEGKPLST